MERNEALETYQKETYNQDIATYTFSVEVAGVTSPERTELKAKKPGINLHFLRYGVFSPRWYYKTSFIDVHAPEDNRPYEYYPTNEDSEVVNPKDPIELDEVFISAKRTFPPPSDKASKLNTAQYRVTGINEGYIYIHEEGKENFWLEFAVDTFGFLHPVLWKDNVNEDGTYKDIRDVISNETLTSHIIKEGTKIWVTLSQAQLSIEQLQKYADNPDSFDRLQSLVCNPIEKTSDIAERKEECFRAFNEFTASFTVYEEKNTKVLQSRLDHIAQLEYPENRDEEDATYEDLFLLLEDPVQCANDLTDVIDGEMAWLKALTDTLKTGKSAYDVYDKLMELPIYSNSTVGVSQEEAEEIGYIFALALTTYKFIYDNEELKDDFSRKHGKWYLNHGIDDEKLDKILAITQRKKQRALINNLRDDLGTLLKSEYYNTALKDFKESSCPMQETGKDIIADHLGTLVVHPTMVDRHLLLVSEYKPYEDKWVQQVRKTITGNSEFIEINELLNLRIPIDKVEQEDSKANIYALKFCKKFLSHYGKMVKAYMGVGALKETEIKLVDTKVNYLTKVSKNGKEGPFVKINRKDFLMSLAKKEGGFEKYKQYRSSNYNHFTKTYAFLKIHKDVLEESKNIARRTGAGKETSIVVQGRDRLPYSKQLEKMVQSPEYKSAVLVFEIWALVNSIEKGNKNEWSIISKIDLGGAMIKTTAAGLKLTEELDKIKAASEVRDIAALEEKIQLAKGAEKVKLTGKLNNLQKLSDSKIKSRQLFGKITRRFSIAGSAFTVYSATKDMVKAINANDNDAALAYSAAAGISGYLLAVELGMTTLSTGPFIVVAGIGLLFYGLAYYLTDSDLEKFFKHYPFSTQMTHATSSDNPFLYARALYKHRDKYIKQWETKYMEHANVSYKHLFVRLTNLLAGGMLKIEGSSEPRSKNDRGHYLSATGHSNTISPNSGLWISMDIRISFASFLQEQNQIEYEVYLLQKKDMFSKPVSYRITNRELQPFMVKQENGTQQLQLWLQVPKELQVRITEPEKQTANVSIMLQQTRTTTQSILIQPDARIAVLCKFKGNTETIFPLTLNDTHGYLYTNMQIGQRNAEGLLIRRSFDSMIIKKEAFLKAYPLQNPK